MSTTPCAGGEESKLTSGSSLYSLAYGATGGRKRGGGGGDAAVVKLLQTGWVPTTDILPASIVLAAHLSYPMLLDEHILLVPADLGPAGAKPLPLHIPEANDASTAPVYLGRVPFRSRNATLYLLNHSGRVSVVFLECTAVLTAGESEYSPLTVLGLAPGHFAEDVEEAVATVVDAEVSCLVALRYRGGEIWLYELRLGSEGADQVVPATLKGSLVGREAGVERIAFSVCGNRLVSLVGVGRGGAVVTWMFNVVPTERSAEIRVELASMKRRRRFWRR